MRLISIIAIYILLTGCGPFSKEENANAELLKNMKEAVDGIDQCNSIGFSPRINVREVARDPYIKFKVICVRE